MEWFLEYYNDWITMNSPYAQIPNWFFNPIGFWVGQICGLIGAVCIVGGFIQCIRGRQNEA